MHGGENTLKKKMPLKGKKSLTLYVDTVQVLGKKKKYGETWDEYLLNLLKTSAR